MDDGEDFFEKNSDSPLAKNLLDLAEKLKEMVQ